MISGISSIASGNPAELGLYHHRSGHRQPHPRGLQQRQSVRPAAALLRDRRTRRAPRTRSTSRRLRFPESTTRVHSRGCTCAIPGFNNHDLSILKNFPLRGRGETLLAAASGDVQLPESHPVLRREPDHQHHQLGRRNRREHLQRLHRTVGHQQHAARPAAPRCSGRTSVSTMARATRGSSRLR